MTLAENSETAEAVSALVDRDVLDGEDISSKFLCKHSDSLKASIGTG